jgi:PKD repeat protein
MMIALLTPLARVMAQENTVTYYPREELPISLSWWNSNPKVTIEINDDISNVTQAVLILTVYDVDRKNEVEFEIEGEDYNIRVTGDEQTTTSEYEIPIEDLSSTVIIEFFYTERLRGDGVEVIELWLILTFSGPANPFPIADPGGIYYGIEGSKVQFDGSGSYDPDGTIQAYFWDFGDASTSTEPNPSYSYVDEGEFLVSLTVTDDTGRSTMATTQAIIDDSDPIASFAAIPVSTTPTLIYRFNDTSISHDGIEQWRWDFGDGTQSTDPEPLHAYSLPGNYSVSLTVSEADGDQSTLTAVILISVDPYVPLIIEIRPKTQAGIPGDSLTYFIDVTNQVTSYPGTSTFFLTAQIPHAWNGSLSLPSLTIPPGETQSSLLTLTSPLSAIPGEYDFTITVTDEKNSIRTRTVTGSYVLAGPPQVTVSALVEDRPPVRFTVTCVAQPDGILQEIKLYINDQIVKTWTQAGTYTYDWVPLTTDLATYYVTASTASGFIVSDPSSGVYSLTQPDIPWNLFLYGLLAIVSLFLVIYYGMHR